MGCCGTADWKREEVPDHKFDFIDVRDYWTNGALTRLRYGLLFVLVVKSIAVYMADIYTAVTLLALNHFSGSIYQSVQDSDDGSVKVPLIYGKWVFTGCIIFGFLLLAYEAHKARAIIRSRDISYAYTNVMANDYYSLRSYEHFCFFCQINNSKKKKDEFAFFIFFTFKGWKRLLVADGPRQVINILTLYALGERVKWSTDISQYYDNNVWTLVLLLTMLFTVTMFVLSALLLIIAAVMYLPLICYIKGNLKEYCCHKIDKRIAELVQKKKKQRLAKHAAIARAEAAGDFSHLKNKKGEIVRQAMQHPTLPKVDVDLFDDSPKMKGAAPHGREGSIASTGFGEKGGMYDQGEAGSTAHLMLNAGQPGAGGVAPSSSGHGFQSSSLPNSPDAYPLHVRGGQGGLPQRTGSPSHDLLTQLGPIGTSPAFAAQVMRGRGGAGHSDRSPLAPAGAQQRYDHAGHAYADAGVDYPPPAHTAGADGLEYPPPAPYAGAAEAPPADLSAFAPYDGHRGVSPAPSYGAADVVDMYTREHGYSGTSTPHHGAAAAAQGAAWEQYEQQGGYAAHEDEAYAHQHAGAAGSGHDAYAWDERQRGHAQHDEQGTYDAQAWDEWQQQQQQQQQQRGGHEAHGYDAAQAAQWAAYDEQQRGHEQQQRGHEQQQQQQQYEQQQYDQQHAAYAAHHEPHEGYAAQQGDWDAQQQQHYEQQQRYYEQHQQQQQASYSADQQQQRRAR